ncbi:MAG: energy transducer TonB [Bacteroidetes bacterium HGW-Bacteroidetes-6]|jgi:protein TonB|nr:MAG: energy transducer TonB [Bacteroidetes bacterium HGW-Bacteroidetes-6]
MKPKKKDSKNMEKFKSIFFQTGLLISLFVVLAAFEWKKYDSNNNNFYQQVFVPIDDELATITKEEPPKTKIIQPTTIFDIKDDNVVINDTLVFDPNPDINQTVVKHITIDTTDIVINDPPPVFIAPVMPEFPGGTEALYNFLGGNIKYPSLARESNIQGTVFVTFVIEKDGSVTNAQILRGIGGGCDEEAMRVVRKMPNWNPGQNSLGRPVRVQLNLPVRFVLEG